MHWILTALLCVVIVEIARQLPFAVVGGTVIRTGRKTARVVSSSAISDHWKEKAMGAYARATFAATLKLALYIVLVLAAAALITLIFNWISPGFARFLLGWMGLLASVVFASAYFYFRGAPVASDYGPLDRLLHRAALQFQPVAELSFDLDQKSVTSDPAEIRAQPHVFVAGLARAGTTILMRRFYGTGQYCSLTYRNMPFVLAPNLWGKLSGLSQRKIAASERAHGDGIVVDADSPESMDEVYWRIFDGARYIRPDHLAPHDPDTETRDGFADFVAAVLQAQGTEGQRYLSKNNNNILRLGALRETFPDALILVPFRSPLTHAGSLLRQHLQFLDSQSDDPFVQDYMGWLGHHEFGAGHLPFRFGAEDEAALAGLDPKGLDYWLELWAQVYGHLIETAPEGAIFVCYEDLCADPFVWDTLARRAGLSDLPPPEEPFTPSRTSPDEAPDAARLSKAEALYESLRARSKSG